MRTLGVVLAGGKTPQLEARQWLDNALGHDPRDAIALSNLVNLDTIYCDWTALDASSGPTANSVDRGRDRRARAVALAQPANTR